MPITNNLSTFDWVDNFALDNAVELVAQYFQTPIAGVSFIDNNIQWLKSKIGLTENSYPISNSFCQYTITHDGVFEISDISNNQDFKDTAAALANPDFKFYAGIQLKSIHGLISTLFIADFMPKSLNDQEKKSLITFASNIYAILALNNQNSKPPISSRTIDYSIKQQLNSVIDNLSNTISNDYQSLQANNETIKKSYWVEVSASSSLDDSRIENIKINTDFIDVTEKKRKDAEILTLISTQNAIFNGVSFAVIFTDTNGIIRRINKAGLDLIGYTNDETVGKTPEFFHDPEEVRERSLALSLEFGKMVSPGFDTFVMKARLENKVDVNEWTYITKEGKRIPINLSVTCIKNNEGEIIGYLGVAEDYTEKKQAKEELIKAKNDAEMAVHAKDSFLANMSHEIRTPLNAIIGFTELLSQSKLDASQHEYINHIQVAGDNLLLIINDILDLSKIESGQLVIETYPFNITDTLNHVYSLLKIKAAQNNIDFSLSLADDLPEYILGDKGRINQILVNLAGNAIKFTKDGKVTISVKKVNENNDSITLQFSVKDTGIGIPQEKLNSIFDRFTQAEASTTRRFGGSGLGLNIVKQLVSLQKGKLFVESKLGEGSEFYFIVTFQKVDSSTVDNIKDTTLKAQSISSLSILLCEDNQLNQILAKNVLHNFGFSVDIANNGQEAIEALAQNKYQLILMDLQMPIMDGYQATIYIRNVLNSNIPIIAMTAHSLVGEQQKCFDIGMNGYLAKPFKQHELLEKIQSVVENSEFKEKMATQTPEESTNNTPEESINNTPEEHVLDLSYLESIGGGNTEFIKEMISLFMQGVPTDVEQLEQKILEKEVDGVKAVAHHMKSSLGMFGMSKEVKFLEKTEQNAKNGIISTDINAEFPIFKASVQRTLNSMQAYIK
ncbi:multi-sensor hybrid histidine kinase [Emticicia oligotrophica DSM 17448]|uniref:histidine kinase n=1 Tax=Emticicia oligotrophica (strain DSM 17448 / CIP 109782 / MTCC 6937 / GPTSA100-15) TaxID=929562 RepID=A0ABM5MY55_EMTOG|nr:response regulator [Emticicia oligotrophica]AFK02058.1 multi-sensor hybrid histidine kinase [Emticicia oligotrophica DSM 17448]